MAFNGKLFLVLLGVLTSIIIKPEFLKFSKLDEALTYSVCGLIGLSIVFLIISSFNYSHYHNRKIKEFDDHITNLLNGTNANKIEVQPKVEIDSFDNKSTSKLHPFYLIGYSTILIILAILLLLICST